MSRPGSPLRRAGPVPPPVEAGANAHARPAGPGTIDLECRAHGVRWHGKVGRLGAELEEEQMVRLDRIHHVGYFTDDLEAAIGRYRETFPCDEVVHGHSSVL